MTDPSGEHALRRLLDELTAAGPAEDLAPLELPGGREWNPPFLEGPMHLIDGDGSSLCQRVDPDRLVLVGPTAWAQTPASRRCRACQTLLDIYRGER